MEQVVLRQFTTVRPVQEAAYHLPCTQSVILQDEAESLPILGQSSGLSPGRAPSCIIIPHESRERRAAGSSEQHSPAAELELESLALNSAWK